MQQEEDFEDTREDLLLHTPFEEEPVETFPFDENLLVETDIRRQWNRWIRCVDR